MQKGRASGHHRAPKGRPQIYKESHKKMNAKQNRTALEEPVSCPEPDVDSLAECRNDIEGLAQLSSQLIASVGNQAEISRRFTERLLLLEQRLQAMETVRQHSAVYVGEHTALTWVLNRYKMYVDTRDKAISVHLLTEGGWESDTTHLLANIVTAGMKVVDVGANMGYFSLLLADRVGPGGFLWAFEPDPGNFQLLRWNLDVNGFTPRTQVFSIALFDRRTSVRLWQNSENLGGHSVLTGDSAQMEGDAVTVDAAPLDDYTTGPIDVMKIDAEGSEPFIWDGMRHLIARSPNLRILMEFDPVQIRGKGRDPRSFLDAIRRDGFQIQRIFPDASLHPVVDEALARGPLVMLHLSHE